jgi:hypothetical protein
MSNLASWGLGLLLRLWSIESISNWDDRDIGRMNKTLNSARIHDRTSDNDRCNRFPQTSLVVDTQKWSKWALDPTLIGYDLWWHKHSKSKSILAVPTSGIEEIGLKRSTEVKQDWYQCRGVHTLGSWECFFLLKTYRLRVFSVCWGVSWWLDPG